MASTSATTGNGRTIARMYEAFGRRLARSLGLPRRPATSWRGGEEAQAYY